MSKMFLGLFVVTASSRRQSLGFGKHTQKRDELTVFPVP